MPAGGGAANAGMPGQEPLDLGVCISILKRAIVFLPVLIMLIIYLVKVTLTHEDYPGDGDDDDSNVTLSNQLEGNVTISDGKSLVLEALLNNVTKSGV